MIKIYTKNDCSWCVKTKLYMQKHNIVFDEVHIGKDMTREEFLEQFPQIKTIPAIFIDEKYIGGYINLTQKFGGEHVR